MNVMISAVFWPTAQDYQGLTRHSAASQFAYIGFDATAKSLHVGSPIQIMMLRWLQKKQLRDHLAGGGTTKVGDPSFRG
jgi:tyrosyl-tRNA synthetase